MKKYGIEFIGTFFLVLTVGLSQNPLAIGAVLAAMVYMGGYISGAHYNPAVTFAMWLLGKIKQPEAVRYMLAQLLAGVAAALTYYIIRGTTFTAHPGDSFSFGAVLLAEIIFTFALVSVVLHTAVSKQVKGNDYYGLAIGLTVMAGAFAVGPVSGAAFNPAVGVGPILYDIAHLQDRLGNLLLYLVGPLAGGWLAALAYRHTSAD